MVTYRKLKIFIFTAKSNKIVIISSVWFLLSFALLCYPSNAEEKILQFHSDITVHEDSTMTVCETIKVVSEGREIRHGIYRDFPTKYKGGTVGMEYVVSFDIASVTRDGEPEDYFIKAMPNGKRIYIGKKEVFINPGEHTYTILYKTDRQIGFFNDHDELYWNVTGNGWVFPIDEVSATVYLPAGIPRETIVRDGYTGSYGERGTRYKSWCDDVGDIHFVTTVSLRSHEGLTIVTSWPKGFIKPPNLYMRWWYFICDAKVLLIAGLGILVLLAYYFFTWSRVGRDPKKGVVIPIYTPPLGLSPAAIRYILKMGYHNKVFAASLINLAVNGYLTIKENSKYLLEKKPRPDPNQKLSQEEESLYIYLPETLELKQENYAIISSLIETLKDSLRKSLTKRYFVTNMVYLVPGMGISLTLIIGEFLMLISELVYEKSGPLIVLVATCPLLIGINVLFGYLLKAPTLPGRKVMDQIEGFKMYLSAVEGDRLNRMNPPDKIPELFEKYLPYALALDIEQQWAEQFTEVFQKAAGAGTEYPHGRYSPRWYHGYSWNYYFAPRFTTSLGKSFTHAISSSSHPPGSSSGGGWSGGGGGGGHSGGGGGGGGGGGW
ncbi:MAG: DUF2207 domain-containing protein [Candidatus Brocadiaceae bacterium]